jgi:hypothetical protein
MNAVGLLPIAELWRNTMRKKQLKMVPLEHVNPVAASLVDTTKAKYVQDAKRI